MQSHFAKLSTFTNNYNPLQTEFFVVFFPSMISYDSNSPDGQTYDTKIN